jgi:hypothetical protein
MSFRRTLDPDVDGRERARPLGLGPVRPPGHPDGPPPLPSHRDALAQQRTNVAGGQRAPRPRANSVTATFHVNHRSSCLRPNRCVPPRGSFCRRPSPRAAAQAHGSLLTATMRASVSNRSGIPVGCCSAHPSVAHVARRLCARLHPAAPTIAVHGHENVLGGGQMRSPLVATEGPRWWPREVLTSH